MSVAETACGDNVDRFVSSAIAPGSKVLRSGLVPDGSVVRNAKAFAEGRNVSGPHRLATIVTKAALPLHSCISVFDQLACHNFTSLLFRVLVETDVQQLHIQLPLSRKLSSLHETAPRKVPLRSLLSVTGFMLPDGLK